uniref:Reverse transcriptase/retrotransposon-derived protein RNase H-like domain-containing protein n=1 Tax=Denticeps clupeoides TaxID=299321 RepID=A0AAY4D7Z3_9TELE
MQISLQPPVGAHCCGAGGGKQRVLLECCRVAEVQFHGHSLSAAGLKPDPENVRAIMDIPKPTDAKGVQRLIGFANYLAKFMPHLTSICEPLRHLLVKDTPWHWLPKHEAAVHELKSLVTNMPVQRYYDSDCLGCCLMQEGQSVAFASRALTTAEKTMHRSRRSVSKPLLSTPKRATYNQKLQGQSPWSNLGLSVLVRDTMVVSEI